MGLGRGNSQKRLVQFVRIRILFAEKGTGNGQKQDFVNKNRYIVSVKNMVDYTTTNNCRYTEKYQYSQFATNVHPRLPPRTLLSVRSQPYNFSEERFIIISNNNRLSKEKNTLI